MTRESARRPRALPWLAALAAVGLSTAFTGVAQPPQPGAASVLEVNRAVARRFVEEVWNKGDLSAVAATCAPNAVGHFRGKDFPSPPETARQVVERWRQAFPDFKFTIEDLIAEGDKVALRIPFTGTHQGPLMGIAPTGKHVAVTEMLILRFEQGKIAEFWEDFDDYGMRMQLGVLPCPK